jgi:hypothetical protein
MKFILIYIFNDVKTDLHNLYNNSEWESPSIEMPKQKPPNDLLHRRTFPFSDKRRHD